MFIISAAKADHRSGAVRSVKKALPDTSGLVGEKLVLAKAQGTTVYPPQLSAAPAALEWRQLLNVGKLVRPGPRDGPGK